MLYTIWKYLTVNRKATIPLLSKSYKVLDLVQMNSYKKNYVYLNEYTMYAVEDITGTHTDPYHYKLYWHTREGVSIEAK